MSRAGVVVNPTKVESGFRDLVCGMVAEHGWEPPLWLETTADDPGRGQAERARAAGVDVVMAAGGDGTVMACITGLAGSGTPLAVLPAGTGNLLVRNLDLPTDLAEAVEAALTGRDRPLDVGTTEAYAFAVMAGMGFDAAMMADAPEPLKARIGWPAYVVSGLRHLRDSHMDVTISIDDAPPQRWHARTVLVGNVGTLTGGLELIPEAEPDDGVLDVVVVAPRHLIDWARIAGQVLRRRPRDGRQQSHLRGRHVLVEARRPQPRELDGDPIEPSTTLDVTVRPKALLLRVPS